MGWTSLFLLVNKSYRLKFNHPFGDRWRDNGAARHVRKRKWKADVARARAVSYECPSRNVERKETFQWFPARWLNGSLGVKTPWPKESDARPISGAGAASFLDGFVQPPMLASISSKIESWRFTHSQFNSSWVFSCPSFFYLSLVFAGAIQIELYQQK